MNFNFAYNCLMSQNATIHATKLAESEELQKLRKFYPDIDFSKDIEKNPDVAEFLRQVISKEAIQVADPLLNANAPKLDDDMSMYFLINNLPKCKEDKVSKLVALIMKTLTTKGLKIEE